jgi:hypothetical protein
MSFNRLNRRNHIGPRFGELMGKHCHAALTAAARGKREEYDRCVADIYQMLDTVENETNWPETKREDPRFVKEKKDAPTKVAPESEPAAPSAGSTTPAPEGPAVSKPASSKPRSTNKRKKRTARPTGSGAKDRGATGRESDVSGESQ